MTTARKKEKRLKMWR